MFQFEFMLYGLLVACKNCNNKQVSHLLSSNILPHYSGKDVLFAGIIIHSSYKLDKINAYIIWRSCLSVCILISETTRLILIKFGINCLE
jgi:hypothetical protein